MSILEEIYHKKTEASNVIGKKHAAFKPSQKFHTNDYSDNYVHTGSLPQSHIRNIENTVEGYPKLQKLAFLPERKTGFSKCHTTVRL